MHSITRRLASASRSSSSSWTRVKSTSVRHLHVRRALPYSIEDGMGKFLTPEGLRTIAVDYQQGLLDRLNDEIHGAYA
jgi:superoxide dismutase, Fe-Mn family